MSRQDDLPDTYRCEFVKQGQILTPFQRKLLQKHLQANLRPEHRLRIEIMLLVDEGKSQTQICKTLSCSQDTARHWISMARAGRARDWNAFPIGRPQTVNDQYLERLQELVSHSPRHFGYPFQRWTGQWLSQHLTKEFGIKVGDRHINRLLKQMGLSTRPQPATNQQVTNQPDANNTRIVIRDLTSASAPAEFPAIWPFDSIS